MRLKELEIQGFKSFPDKTRLTIGEGITGIVGPNGSGKSNISDAIRWVMGETSSKQLRGAGKMEDVIFGGTQTRGAMGYASVSLTIDNTDHGLDMDADEVTIGRRYYRSGESEYSINGQSVRLKDIYELLLDTGLGRDGYAIVGQGRIAEIVAAKSGERREIFEEASGIARYRYRKNEAERRLAAAEGNLERLRDILGELERRVGPLKRDSEKAQQFLELSGQRKSLEVTLWVDAIRRAKDTVRDQQRRYEAAQADYDRLSRSLDEYDEKSEALRARTQQLMLQVEESNAQIRAITEENAGSDSRIAVLNNENEHSRRQIEEARAELSRAGEGQKGIELEAEAHRAAIEKLNARIAQADETAKDLDRQLDALEQQAMQSGQQRDLLNAAILRCQQAATAAQVQHATAESAANAAEARLQDARAQKQQNESDAETAGRQQAEAADRLKQAEEAVTRLDNVRAGLRLKLDSRKRQQAEAADALQKAERELSAAAQRIHILEDLERNLDGYQQSVKTVMRAAGSGRLRGVIGPVAGILTVRKGYEVAIETALGFALQNIVVEDEKSARAAIAFLKAEKGGPRHLSAAGHHAGQPLQRPADRHRRGGRRPGGGRPPLPEHRQQPAGPHHRGGGPGRGLRRGPEPRLPQPHRHAGRAGHQRGRQLHRRLHRPQRGRVQPQAGAGGAARPPDPAADRPRHRRPGRPRPQGRGGHPAGPADRRRQREHDRRRRPAAGLAGGGPPGGRRRQCRPGAGAAAQEIALFEAQLAESRAAAEQAGKDRAAAEAEQADAERSWPPWARAPTA